jgi:hypothetical protein
MNQLVGIKNLEGLSVEAAQSQFGFGFALKHHDGHYPEKQYLFPSAETQALWLNALSGYQRKDVFKKYKVL